MKYLVLGSAGQIGAALTSKIREIGGHEVLEFDIENHPSQDLRIHDNEVLEAMMKEADFIFFLAFDVGGSRYLNTYQNTYDFISNNIKIIDRTFDALKRHQKPFVFASSQMANMSHSSYGLLKSIAEKKTQILNGLVVKFWNVYGIERDESKFHVITDLILKAAGNGNIDLMTDGTEERQFLHADDCSECLLELSKKYHEISREKPLHVTNFQWHTILDIARLIASHFPGSTITPSPKKDTVQQNKKNEPDPYILEHWTPRTTLEDGIARIVEEMKANPDIYPGMREKNI
jgi:nucleoside-diphosphate-sugar epimerase